MSNKKPPGRFRRMFVTHLQRVKGRLGVAALCTIGVSLTGLLSPWPLKIIIDQIILNKPLPHALHFLSGIAQWGAYGFLAVTAGSIVGIALISGLFQYAQIYISSSIGYHVVYAIRRELFSHLQRLSLSFHRKSMSGDLLSRIVSDTNDLRNLFSDSILSFISNVLMILGMLVVFVAMDWRVALIALGTFPLLGYTLFHLYRKTRVSSKRQKRQEGRVASRMAEVLAEISLVQAYARERHEEERFDEVTAQTIRESVRVARLKAAATRSSQVITKLGTAAAVLFAAIQVLHRHMAPGELVVISSYLSSMFKPMKGLAKLSSDFSKATASAQRIGEVLDVEPEIKDLPDAVEAPRFEGRVTFDGVTFQYGDGPKVLDDVSFSIGPGQRLALVGASGAGKSTVVSLLLRLYQAREGAISIDGEDITKYTRESLRRRIALVLQQSVLFGANIRENIAYGKPEASWDEIVSAAKAANADGFIRRLSDGYDTIIGERGATLSGGQRQRIAIARALIRDAPILILDEPMTGLDSQSVAEVSEALQRLVAGKTCIMITHQLQAVADADKVLLLDAGRVAGMGTHGELLETNEAYRRMYRLSVEPAAEGATPMSSNTPRKPGQEHMSSPSGDAKRNGSSAPSIPQDPEFPQLTLAADPGRMVEIFRNNLKPFPGKEYQIEECVPVRFRCRQNQKRCVLQYMLKLNDPHTGHHIEQWVTGLVYASPGKAERLWKSMLEKDGNSNMPDPWRTLEPVQYIPELEMVVEVFPFDRRMPNLPVAMNRAADVLETALLDRLGDASWYVDNRTLEPTRYRTELGAAFRLTLDARNLLDGRKDRISCYLKVYRKDRGEVAYRTLRAWAEGRSPHRTEYDVVQPIAYLDDLGTLALEAATGTTLHDALRSGDWHEAVGASAAAIASFNQDSGPWEEEHSLSEQLVQVRRASETVEWAHPELAGEASEVTREIERRLEERPSAPIHADLKTDHIFMSDGRVTFIDLDRAGHGDPVRDPAHLYSYIYGRVELDEMSRDSAAEAATEFVDEYLRRAPAEWRDQMAVHCAGALMEVAGGVFNRQEPNWQLKMEETVGRARELLGSSPW